MCTCTQIIHFTMTLTWYPSLSFFFLPHLTSCLSYSSGNKIESKEQGLNIWLMTLCCHRCMTHFVCLPSILAASIPVPLFLSVCACFSLPCLFSYKHGHQVPVWRIKSNMNTVSREHRKAPNEPREARSQCWKRSWEDLILCLWTNTVSWHL